MGIQGSEPRNNYLSKEESFMYDREKSFPMEDTCNEARIEFTENGGLVNLVSRRCQIIKLSKSGAVITMTTKFQLPRNFYLDVVSARIPMIGCLTQRVHAKRRRRSPLPAHALRQGRATHLRLLDAPEPSGPDAGYLQLRFGDCPSSRCRDLLPVNGEKGSAVQFS